jgi:hypothetical protein
LNYLNVNCLLKGGLFCKIETRVSWDIKRMRKEKGATSQEEKNTLPPLKNLKSCIPPF